MRFLRITICMLLPLLLGPAAAPSPFRAGVVASVVWRWPLAGRPEVVRGFEPPARLWLPGHRGVDLAAGEGALVLAAGDGVVRFAGVVVDRPVVSITHANGLITTYEPVTPLVKTGDTVEIGQPIGRLLPGHPGCALPCLHWGLREGSSYLDPLALLGRTRVRLLPLAMP